MHFRSVFSPLFLVHQPFCTLIPYHNRVVHSALRYLLALGIVYNWFALPSFLLLAADSLPAATAQFMSKCHVSAATCSCATDTPPPHSNSTTSGYRVLNEDMLAPPLALPLPRLLLLVATPTGGTPAACGTVAVGFAMCAARSKSLSKFSKPLHSERGVHSTYILLRPSRHLECCAMFLSQQHGARHGRFCLMVELAAAAHSRAARRLDCGHLRA